MNQDFEFLCTMVKVMRNYAEDKGAVVTVGFCNKMLALIDQADAIHNEGSAVADKDGLSYQEFQQ